MARTKAERLENEKGRLDDAVDAGEISDHDRDLIRELIDAYDEDELTTPKPEGDSYRTDATRAAWCERLTTATKRLGELSDITADEINRTMQEMHDEDRQKSTVRNYQNALRRFYRYHDLGVTPEDIATYESDGNGFDPEDILTRDEIGGVKEVIDSPRNNLIFHLLLYTGLRNTALRTLRVKDVKVDEGASGRYRVNPEADGLKGARENGEWRPLLGAVGAVREWLKYHPDPQPENYLITQLPTWPRCDPTQPVTRETIRKVMEDLKGEAGIDKPLHPHMLRHTFVTICKRDYDMDNDTIKFLIHHSPDSRVMETTYSHLSDEDWNKRAEGDAGYTDTDADLESTLSPPSCEVCDESLPPKAKACATCGTVYTPDARAAKEQIETAIKQDYASTDPDDETIGKIELADELLNDPEMKQEVIKEIADDPEFKKELLNTLQD